MRLFFLFLRTSERRCPNVSSVVSCCLTIKHLGLRGNSKLDQKGDKKKMIYTDYGVIWADGVERCTDARDEVEEEEQEES